MTSPAAMQVRHLFAFCVFPLLCFVLIELLFFVQTGLWLELELELVPLCSFLMDFKYVFVISGVASSSESGGSGVLWGVFLCSKMVWLLRFLSCGLSLFSVLRGGAFGRKWCVPGVFLQFHNLCYGRAICYT